MGDTAAIALGQRVESWTVSVETESSGTQVARGATIGRKRITRFQPIATRRMKIDLTRARACPALTSVSAYGR
jgi:alpha-L-fucosidase